MAINKTSAPTANYTLNVINLPSTYTDIIGGRTQCFSVINATSSPTYFSKTLTLSTTSTVSTNSTTAYFPSGSSSVSTSSTFNIQSFAIMYLSSNCYTTGTNIVSNVNTYQT